MKLQNITKHLATYVALFASLAVFFYVATEVEAYNLSISPKDSCGLVSISNSETPSCPALADINSQTGALTRKSYLSNVNTTFYTHKITFTNIDPYRNTHTIKAYKGSNFCTEPLGQVGKDPSSGQYGIGCNSSLKSATEEFTLAYGESKTVEISRSSDNGLACGSYQTDLYVESIDNNKSCNTPAMHPLAGVCQTGNECVYPSATPTPTITSTPTPTPTCTPGPTSTPGPSYTPTITPHELPRSGGPNLLLFSLFFVLPVGLILSKFTK
jgi:hypothetical protein